jgi:formylglycine-generating enzyme required for sulfatase activity/energy-coupling factor transporter ATP-binding protein EcfA2
MSDLLPQAIAAIMVGEKETGQALLRQVLEDDPYNETAWAWLSGVVASPAERQTCLEWVLTINPANQAVQRALLAWQEQAGLPASLPPGLPTAPTEAASSSSRPAPSSGPPLSPPPAALPQTRPVPPQPAPALSGSDLNEFLQQLKRNYNILKAREAKYATVAPLDLLNQIDDYEQAISLSQQALAEDVPLAELQSQFAGLNLQIDTIVFIAQEPPRKPFTGQNPYRGLRKFTEDEAEFFFGRTAAIEGLLELVAQLIEAKTTLQQPDFIAVLGASGSGKSSLVRAGLIPALQSGRIPGSESWLIRVMVPGPRPLDSLAETFIGLSKADLATTRAKLNQVPEALHYLMAESLAGKANEARFVLVIDQFEELFTLCESLADRQAFLALLLHACQLPNSRAFVIVTMRADFYAKAATHKALAEIITQSQMLVGPMTDKELREAILLPAEAVGLEMEKDLIQALVNDALEAPGALPLLQQALAELFHYREGNLLNMAAYEKIGGIKGALAHRADAILDSLSMSERHTVRRILMRLVQLGEGTADTRRRASFHEVIPHDSDPAEIDNIIQLLSEANMIVTSRSLETDEVVIDVSHEALISEWPRFKSWLDWDRQGLRVRQQLAQAARDWDERQRDPDSLYRGSRLLELEEWVSENPDEINQLEEDFLEACINERDREIAEQQAQHLRELAAAHKLAEEAKARQQIEAKRVEEQLAAAARLRRRALWVTGVGVLAVFLAIAAVWFGLRSIWSADAARAAQIEAERQALLAGDNAKLAATREAEAAANAALAEANAATAQVHRANAEAASTAAIEEQAIALAAQATAKAEAINASDAKATLAVLLELVAVKQEVQATPTATVTPTTAGTPAAATASPAEFTPTATATATPNPTPDQTATAVFLAVQQQLNEIKATQTAEAGLTRDMIRVPAGPFLMGTVPDTVNALGLNPDAYGDELPQRTVDMPEFFIDKTEVTNAAYGECVAAGRCAPSGSQPDYNNRPDLPVVWVSWQSAKNYCEWRGKRLPTEAEWEKAARGEDGRLWPWGNSRENRAKIGEVPPNNPVAVGSFAEGQSPYGVLDMIGNVNEWVNDKYSPTYYRDGPTNNPPGPPPPPPGQPDPTVIRGGSFRTPLVDARTADRNAISPSPAFDVGFRCAK